MIRRDMLEVYEIERHGLAQWCEEGFLARLRKENCIGMVAEHGEKVVGFLMYELHKHHLRLTNLAVHPAWRRLGVGRQMIDKIASKLSSHRRTRLTVDVHENNLDGQLFFKSQRFFATQVLHGDDGDVYSMRLLAEGVQ
jgi:ribosomal-protein-alanine N-acetyltransferase